VGGLVIVDGPKKDQVAGLELTETYVLCGRHAAKTHIRNMVVFIHTSKGMKVASGHFGMASSEAEITRLESEFSFLQVKASMNLQERVRQVKAEICDNRRQIAHLMLESIAGAENTYGLVQVFGKGHMVTKNRAAVYVTRCQEVEVIPHPHPNCTSEIPVTYNGTDVFVDPHNMVIKSAAAPTRCNDIAPPRWKLGGRWYYAHPQVLDCGEPASIPIDPVKISVVDMFSLGLGKSVYSKEQIDEFLHFLDSKGTRRAYLAKIAEYAYASQQNGEWGLGISESAKSMMIDAVGIQLIPLYQTLGPVAITITLIMFLAEVGKMALEILVQGYAILRVHVCGLWMIAAFWSTLFHLAMAPFNYGWELGGKAGKGVGKAMEVEAVANSAKKCDLHETMVGHFESGENETAIPWRSWRQALYAPMARVEDNSVVPNAKK